MREEKPGEVPGAIPGGASERAEKSDEGRMTMRTLGVDATPDTIVVAAWGAHSMALDREEEVMA